MENTRCPDCRVKLKKEFTCRANLENVPMGNLCPSDWYDAIWTGNFICPKCKKIILNSKLYDPHKYDYPKEEK